MILSPMSVNPTSPWDFFDASGNFLHQQLGTCDRHVPRGEAELEPRQIHVGCIFMGSAAQKSAVLVNC